MSISRVLSRNLSFNSEESRNLIALREAGNYEEFNKTVFAKEAEEGDWDIKVAELGTAVGEIGDSMARLSTVNYGEKFHSSLGDLQEALTTDKDFAGTEVLNFNGIPFKHYLAKTAALHACIAQVGAVIDARREGKKLCICLMNPDPSKNVLLFYKNHKEITREIIADTNFNINFKNREDGGNFQH